MLPTENKEILINKHFLSIIAHDLRNPINILKINAYILKKEINRSGSIEKMENAANNILRISENMGRLVCSLLDACDSGLVELPIKKKKVSFVKIVEEVVKNYNLLSEKNKIKISLYRDADPDKLVECDPDRIQQVMGNLLDNAIKYSAGGGYVLVFLGRRDGCTYVSVTNRKGQAEQNYCQDIFAKRITFDPKTSGSRGLGLFISKLIIEAHGGKIWAEVDGGLFRVYFEVPN